MSKINVVSMSWETSFHVDSMSVSCLGNVGWGLCLLDGGESEWQHVVDCGVYADKVDAMRYMHEWIIHNKMNNMISKIDWLNYNFMASLKWIMRLWLSWWIRFFRYYWLSKQCTSNIVGFWNLKAAVCCHSNTLNKQACEHGKHLRQYKECVCECVLWLQQCICLSPGSWQGNRCLYSSAH